MLCVIYVIYQPTGDGPYILVSSWYVWMSIAPTLAVSLWMMISSNDFRLSLVRAGASRVHVCTCVVRQCSSMVAICGRFSISELRHERKLLTYYGYTCFGVNQTLSWFTISDSLSYSWDPSSYLHFLSHHILADVLEKYSGVYGSSGYKRLLPFLTTLVA